MFGTPDPASLVSSGLPVPGVVSEGGSVGVERAELGLPRFVGEVRPDPWGCGVEEPVVLGENVQKNSQPWQERTPASNYTLNLLSNDPRRR